MEYCAGCPRRTAEFPGHAGAVGAWGSEDAPFLVVGMSPGEQELKAGEPFVGASGALVWGIGQTVGLVRADCRIVNTVSCWPCGSRGKTLSEKQLVACRPHLDQVLRGSQAKVVICLGADAFDAVTGLISWERGEQAKLAKRIKRQGGTYKAKPIGIEQWRGYLVTPSDCPGVVRTLVQDVPDYTRLYKSDKAGKYKKGDPRMKKVKVEVSEPRVLPPHAEWIVGLYHPSFVMRMGRKPLPAFRADLARAVRAAMGELKLANTAYETRVP